MTEMTREEVITKLQQWQKKLVTDVQDSLKLASECPHEPSKQQYPGKQQYERSAAMAQRGVDLLECTLELLTHPNLGIPLETIIERVRTAIAARIGELLTTWEAGNLEVEIIQSIAVPKGEDKPNG